MSVWDQNPAILQSLYWGMKVFFLGHPERYMPRVLAILVAIFFLLALTGRLGFIKWITAGWFLAVIYFTTIQADMRHLILCSRFTDRYC